MRLLLIDDDLDLLGAIARFLREEGYEVRVCDQPQRLSALIEQGMPDLIITDLKMPHESGLDVLRLVRQSHPQIPVLLFSAFASTPDVVTAIELGAAGFLEKTEQPETLLNKIREVLQGLPPPLRAVPKAGGHETPLLDRVKAFERSLIEQALKDSGGSIKDTMAKLGVSRRTLNDKMQRLGVARAPATRSGDET